MFDEEAERLKLSVLDLTEDVVEMILKKKRAKHDANEGLSPPRVPPECGGLKAADVSTASSIRRLGPEPQSEIAVELQEEEPEQFRLRSTTGGQTAAISGNSLGSAPIKKYFHMWHRKLYSA
jgi:hypothetical protein